jgi:hypothetical protein
VIELWVLPRLRFSVRRLGAHRNSSKGLTNRTISLPLISRNCAAFASKWGETPMEALIPATPNPTGLGPIFTPRTGLFTRFNPHCASSNAITVVPLFPWISLSKNQEEIVRVIGIFSAEVLSRSCELLEIPQRWRIFHDLQYAQRIPDRNVPEWRGAKRRLPERSEHPVLEPSALKTQLNQSLLT